MKKKITLSIMLVLIIGLIAGCSGTQKSDEKVLRVGLEGTYPPFNYEEEDGTLTGYDVEVAQEIAKRMDYKIEVITTKWSGMFGALEADKFDMVVNQVAITPEREEKYDFTQPYVTSGAQLIVRAENNDIKNLEDLKGKTVGVGLGSNYEQIIRNYDKNGEIEVKTYEVLLDTLNDLAIGRIDAALNDKLVAGLNIKKTGLDLKLAGQPVKEVVNGIVFTKGKDDLVEKVDQALQEMKEDGTLSQLSKKWFGVDISK